MIKLFLMIIHFCSISVLSAMPNSLYLRRRQKQWNQFLRWKLCRFESSSHVASHHRSKSDDTSHHYRSDGIMCHRLAVSSIYAYAAEKFDAFRWKRQFGLNLIKMSMNKMLNIVSVSDGLIFSLLYIYFVFGWLS